MYREVQYFISLRMRKCGHHHNRQTAASANICRVQNNSCCTNDDTSRTEVTADRKLSPTTTEISLESLDLGPIYIYRHRKIGTQPLKKTDSTQNTFTKNIKNMVSELVRITVNIFGYIWMYISVKTHNIHEFHKQAYAM